MSAKQRQDLPIQESRGGPGFQTHLWMLGTPIGNLSDLSDRAKSILSQVDGVLCEDTRRTANLVTALGLSKSLYRLDQHATPGEISKYVRLMESGKVFAYASDAGTPGVSDPGAKLVQAAMEAGLQVSPVPGPSAVTALLSVAGFDETAFSFRGFFPRKAAFQVQELQGAQRNGGSHIWFESPERIVETLAFLSASVPEATVVVAKELTKTHEKIFRGRLKSISSHIQCEVESEGKVGEWVFAVGFVTENADVKKDESEWKKCLEICIKCGVSASGAAREVSQSFGISRNRVYECALELAKHLESS